MSSDTCWERAEYIAVMTVLASHFYSKKNAQRTRPLESAVDRLALALRLLLETPVTAVKVDTWIAEAGWR